MNIREKTAKGVSWTIISQLSRLLIYLVLMVILAHLLNPSDFGLIAMVAVFSTFFSMFNDIGLSSAIIHKKNVTEEDLSSAFWVNLFEGMAVTLIFLALAPVIARFYSRDILRPIVMIMSMMFTISSFGMIQLALFSKRMDFRPLAIIEIVSALSGGGVAVAMASTGFGVWSIVFYSLVQSTVTAVLLFMFSSWKPKFMVKWKPTKSLLGYGLPVTAFNMVNYFSRNLDNLLIGKFLGSAQLGYYDVAYKSLLFPLGNVSQVIGRVMFPALSSLQDDKARVREAYIRANRCIAVITFPLTLGLAVLAPQVVRVFLGANWERAIFLIQVLAFIGGLQSIYTSAGWLYLSQGKTGVYLTVGVVNTLAYIGAFVIGLRWNIEGVAVAYAIVFLLLLYPTSVIPFRFIDMKFSYYAKHFGTIVAATIIMAGLMLGLRLMFERVARIGDIPILIIVVAIGVSSYLGLLLILDRGLLKDLRGIVRDAMSKVSTS